MLNIDIDYDIKKVEEYMDESKIEELMKHILEREEKINENDEFYLSILITNNDVIQEINKTYRNIDKSTDVISFAYNETENIGPLNVLGDIIVSIEKVKEQSSEYNHSEEREFYYVLTHGMLHLLGYDHIEEEDKKIMRKNEEEILNNFDYKRI